MINLFADRIKNVKPSFIREILKVTNNPEVISFAGGLPHPDSFPYSEIQVSAERVFNKKDSSILQYSITEGSLELRNEICEIYRNRFKFHLSPSDIVITTGSQQALDLIGKIFINKSDNVLIEDPGYLGAIQAFSMYEPNLQGIPVTNGKINLDILDELAKSAKFFYSVPTYQNPTGSLVDNSERNKIAQIIKKNNILIIEDDPYGCLSFEDNNIISYFSLIPNNTILMGSFSKIIAPSLRLGWIAAPNSIVKALSTAKQASDLHSTYLTQSILVDYLKNNDLDSHIEKLKIRYKKQRDCLINKLESSSVLNPIHINNPQGGMFLWATLPNKQSSTELLKFAIDEGVVFVPGSVFSVNSEQDSTLRINFSYLDEAKIIKGVERLEKAYLKYLSHF